MSTTDVLLVIELLERVREKPGMYIGPKPDSIRHFVDGVNCACSLFGLQQERSLRKNIAIEHGWSYDASGIWNDLKEGDYTYDQIVDAILKLEIETWKRTYKM